MKILSLLTLMSLQTRENTNEDIFDGILELSDPP